MVVDYYDFNKNKIFSHLSLHRYSIEHRLRTFYSFLTIIKFGNLLGRFQNCVGFFGEIQFNCTLKNNCYT